MTRCCPSLFLFFACFVSSTAMSIGHGQMREEISSLDKLPITDRSAEDAEVEQLSDVAEAIVRRTNAYRESQSLSAVSTNSELQSAAEQFAAYMARTLEYGHTADDRRPAQRAEEAGYDYCIVTENIAFQYNESGLSHEELAEKFVTGWIDSPKHHENIVDAHVTNTGVAVAETADGTLALAVQMFGRPKSAMLQMEFTNPTDQAVTVSTVEEDQRQFTLQPNSQLILRRCRPVAVKLEEGDEAIQVDASAKFTVESDAQGELTLSRSNP